MLPTTFILDTFILSTIVISASSIGSSPSASEQSVVAGVPGVAAKHYFTPSYCETFGYDDANFDPARQAYELGEIEFFGHAEGTCGWAAAEKDEQWAHCCCHDAKYCCPNGEDAYDSASPNSPRLALRHVSDARASPVDLRTHAGLTA